MFQSSEPLRHDLPDLSLQIKDILLAQNPQIPFEDQISIIDNLLTRFWHPDKHYQLFTDPNLNTESLTFLGQKIMAIRRLSKHQVFADHFKYPQIITCLRLITKLNQSVKFTPISQEPIQLLNYAKLVYLPTQTLEAILEEPSQNHGPSSIVKQDVSTYLNQFSDQLSHLYHPSQEVNRTDIQNILSPIEAILNYYKVTADPTHADFLYSKISGMYAIFNQLKLDDGPTPEFLTYMRYSLRQLIATKVILPILKRPDISKCIWDYTQYQNLKQYAQTISQGWSFADSQPKFKPSGLDNLQAVA